MREADAARWAFGAAMLTPAARQRPNAREGLRRSLAAALMDAGEVEAAIGFLTAEAEASPEDAGLSDPAGAGAADGGRHRRRGGGPAPRHGTRSGGARGLPRLCQRAEGPRPTIPWLCASPRSSRVPTFRPRAARNELRGGQVRCGPARRGGRDRPPEPRQPPDGGVRFPTDSRPISPPRGNWRATGRKLEGLAASGPEDPVLFVTGLPRSGTTLVETILAAHPEVTAGGEMPYLQRALAPAMEALRQGEADPERFAEAGRRYLVAAHRRGGGGPVVADKAISTFSRMGHAAAALPGREIRRVCGVIRGTRACRCGATCFPRGCTATPTTRRAWRATSVCTRRWCRSGPSVCRTGCIWSTTRP
jgi:hypothetical protein